MTEYLDDNNHTGYPRMSVASITVSMVFFVVLSQFLIVRGTTVTHLFRPLVIVMTLGLIRKRGHLRNSIAVIAIVAMIYELSVVLIDINAGISFWDSLNVGVTHGLYLLMLGLSVEVPWTERELKLIVGSVLWGCFVCALVFALSNNMANIHTPTYYLVGVPVNRNKNAYAFALGTLLGIIYFVNTKKLSRRIVVLLMSLLMGYCVLYSQCRGAFFCLVISASVLVVSYSVRMCKQRGIGYLFYIILFIVICIVSYHLLKNSSLNRLVDGESTSGRDDSIKIAWNMYLNSDGYGKVLGNGFLYESTHSNAIGVHLVFLTFLVSSGLIGAGLVSSIFIISLVQSRFPIPIALLFFAFGRAFFEGLDYYIYIPLILSLIINNYQRYMGREFYELIM